MRKSGQVDRVRYEILRNMLEDRAREITAKLRTLREALAASNDAVDPDKDPEDQTVEEYARGLDFALIEMKSRTLEHINEALLRLEAGTYGRCSDCDGAIAKARLQALPFAERCRDCEQAREDLTRETTRQRQRFGAAEQGTLREQASHVARFAAPSPKPRQKRTKKAKGVPANVIVAFGPLAGRES